MSLTPYPPPAPWWVVQCQTGWEYRVAAALAARLDLVVYAPELVRQVRGQAVREPFFPGYLFAQGGAHLPGRAFAALPGHARPVRFAATVATLAPAALDALRADIERVNAGGGRPAARWRAGEAVQVVDGPFGGLDATVLAAHPAGDRVQVLLEVLGGPRPVSLPAHHVGRRDRGHGRQPPAPAVP